jgi:tetratricopeptide (TPR) repeat protein
MGRTRSLEREFLAERLRRIEDFLSDTREYELAKKGLTRYPDRFQPDDFLRRLEADLLLKLLAETEEGKVEKAIKSWRRALSAQLRKHKEFYRLAQQVYDEWANLPWHLRSGVPEPPQPPALEVRDRQGRIWIIDDRLIRVLDGIACRLEKWMSVVEEEAAG